MHFGQASPSLPPKSDPSSQKVNKENPLPFPMRICVLLAVIFPMRICVLLAGTPLPSALKSYIESPLGGLLYNQPGKLGPPGVEIPPFAFAETRKRVCNRMRMIGETGSLFIVCRNPRVRESW